MQESQRPAPMGYSLPNTRYIDLQSSRDGAVWRIFISTPAGEMPAAGWPVLYLTDGNACFPFAVAAHRTQAPYQDGTNIGNGVIVAIGYPTEEYYDYQRRSWDLTPPPGRTWPPFSEGGPDAVTGGSSELLDFIETDLKPYIATLFTIDPSRQSLFGHSFGGLFALYALFSKPQSFTRYIAASPSIYWEESRILDFEKQFLANYQPGGSVMLHLSAGEFEGDILPPFQTGAPDAATRLERKKQAHVIGNAQYMADRLGKHDPQNLSTRYETFAGETHMTVLPVAIGRAIQIAFELPPAHNAPVS